MDTAMKQKRMIKSILVVTAMILIITLPGSLYFTDLRIALIILSTIWFFLEKTDMEYLWYSLIFFLSYDQHMSWLYTHHAPSIFSILGEAIFGDAFISIFRVTAFILVIPSFVFLVIAWIQNFRVISQSKFALISLIFALLLTGMTGFKAFLFSLLSGLTIFLGRKVAKQSENKTGEFLLMHFLLTILSATDIHYYRVDPYWKALLILTIIVIYLPYGFIRTKENQKKVIKYILIFQGLISLVLIVFSFIGEQGFIKPVPAIGLLTQYFFIQLIFLYSPEIIRKDRPKPLKTIKDGEAR
jgi:hypothetical protein